MPKETTIELQSNSLNFLGGISTMAKLEINKEKEFFQFKENGKLSTFYAFTKTGINALNGKAGTGKSLVLNEIMLYLLHTQQLKSVIWIDLDNNYTTLKKRNQAQFIQQLDNFFVLTDEIILTQSQNELANIKADIATLEKNHTAEQLESGINAPLYSELKGKMDKLQTLVYKCDFLALLEFVLLSNDINLADTAIVIDSLSDLFDSGKAEIIQPIFFNILRPLTNKGASIFYLNHLTKDNGTGKRNYAGSHKLEGKTDYFTLISKPIKDQDLLNVEPTKDRHGNGDYFAFSFDLTAPLGQRLFKCDYLDSVDGFTDSQNEALRAIRAELSTGDKTATELERVVSKTQLYRLKDTTEFSSLIETYKKGVNTFYSLKSKKLDSEPTIYEPIAD